MSFYLKYIQKKNYVRKLKKASCNSLLSIKSKYSTYYSNSHIKTNNGQKTYLQQKHALLHTVLYIIQNIGVYMYINKFLCVHTDGTSTFLQVNIFYILGKLSSRLLYLFYNTTISCKNYFLFSLKSYVFV